MLPVPNSPYGLCGRKATLHSTKSDFLISGQVGGGGGEGEGRLCSECTFASAMVQTGAVTHNRCRDMVYKPSVMQYTIDHR